MPSSTPPAPAKHLQVRIAATALVLVLIPLAYWLRFYAPLGSRLRDWSGGAAYVIFWSALVRCAQPRLSALRSTLWVLFITCLLEFLQLWHPGWLEACRRTLPGRLVLGTTFDWADFPAYFGGALLSLGFWRVFDGISGSNQASQPSNRR